MELDDTLVVESDRVQEDFFARGWTDGLPVVAPTPRLVEAMLDQIDGADPELMIGYLPVRQRGVTLEKAAVNAVMAGCKAEYFPIVVAAIEALFDQDYNLHAILASTGGSALCVIVSGPMADEIGMNARHNLLGPGNRANATIGRALRLVAMNLLGASPGVSDASSFGHQGKYTFCFAEDPPPEPWLSLRVGLGYDAADTTVTVVPSGAPWLIAQQLTQDADAVLRTFASVMRTPSQFISGKAGQGVVLIGPEHAGFCLEAGMSQADVREFLFRESRITPAELLAAGVETERGSGFAIEPDAEGKLPSMASPDHILLVTAGGEGAGWSTWIPNNVPVASAHAVSRRVRPAGEPLPECGPDGCLVPWMEKT
jgi:hypothetical protein